jgi:phage terminase Nu1 subunit (DNA packaging protein)
VVGVIDLSKPAPQAQIGALVGVSQQAISEFYKAAALGPAVPAGEVLIAYCERLREIAAGRGWSEGGGLDLAQERAALAREMRLGHEIKNEVARKTYAPITLLAETLAMASQAVVERFEQLPSALKKTCPDLPEAARDQVAGVIAAARNEWVARTQQLVTDQLSALEDEAAGFDEEIGA